MAEEDDFRPDELVQANVAAFCYATNSDDCLSCGGNGGTTTEPDDTDGCQDGRAVNASSTASSPHTTAVSPPTTVVLILSYPTPTSLSLQPPPKI